MSNISINSDVNRSRDSQVATTSNVRSRSSVDEGFPTPARPTAPSPTPHPTPSPGPDQSPSTGPCVEPNRSPRHEQSNVPTPSDSSDGESRIRVVCRYRC